jgi:hypothetical protein
MSDTITTTITSTGYFDKAGRKFVSERACDTQITNVDKGVATG